MKKAVVCGLLGLCLSGSALAARFERIVSCSSHDLRVSGKIQLEGVSLREMTEACSLAEAAKHGQRVCESEGFAWLRRGEMMIFTKATIHETTCKKIDGDYTCETAVTVECE